MVQALAVLVALLGAMQDNNVEWNGVSHRHPYDLRPLCPVGGESFQVRGAGVPERPDGLPRAVHGGRRRRSG